MAHSPLATGPSATLTVSQPNSNGALVLLGGLGTTMLALAGVFVSEKTDFNVMGWYVDYILPVGALLVGAVAASGYGVASWVTGTKITGRLLWTVVALLAGSYVAAQYLEYHLLFPHGALLKDGTELGFWQYYDVMTRSIRFEEHGEPGSPLGLLGYGVRCLEALGFVGGGAAVPALLRSLPYCATCQRYKRTTELGSIPASLVSKRVSKSDTAAVAARQAEEQAVVDRASEGVKAILDAAAAGDGTTVKQHLATYGFPKGRPGVRLPLRLIVSLVACRQCLDAELKVESFTRKGRNIQRRTVSRVAVSLGVAAQLLPTQ